MSIDNTDDLKHTWQADTDRALQGRDCPDNERIFDAVAGTLPVRERRKLIAHTSVCGACAQAWRVALELQRAMPADTSSNVRQLPARARFPTRGADLGACPLPPRLRWRLAWPGCCRCWTVPLAAACRISPCCVALKIRRLNC